MERNKHGGEEEVFKALPSHHQTTLKTEIRCTGIGLHSGQKTTIILKPAAPDTGIVFHRTDLGEQPVAIPARWDYVIDTRMCTVVGLGPDVRVATIEHLMAALHGCGIDNLIIDIDGPEVPIMDGSSSPFVFLIECAGTEHQDVPRKVIEVLKPISVTDGDREGSLSPSDDFSVSIEIDFDHPVIAKQTMEIQVHNSAFKAEVARARTFGFLSDEKLLKAANLAQGASFGNTIIIGDTAIENTDGLRYTNEFVRHKILDCIGDLYLGGAPIKGAFKGIKSGHKLHNLILRELFKCDKNWRYVEAITPDIRVAEVTPATS